MKKLWYNLILPLIPMVLWGSLFPFIKIGYEAFSIDQESVPDILVFAAMRFTVCGIIVCLIGAARKAPFAADSKRGILWIIISGMFSIVLHYAFTYIGLTMTDSSKTALLKQLGALFYICFAFLFIKNERLSKYKFIGGIVGFLGIIAINFTGAGISFEVGDILIILASVCSVIATVLSKKCVEENNSPFWIVGISQLVGGAILFAAGIIMGGKIPTFTPLALLVFAYICASSIIAYVLFSVAQKYASNSALFIIKFAEPLFACVFGAILLGENIFNLQYLLAFILISGGIILGNRGAKTENAPTTVNCSKKEN